MLVTKQTHGGIRMLFQYLGTAAAEGWPGLFCGCEHCETVRKLGGRNIRTRSQAVVYGGSLGEHEKGMLVIDLPPDTYLHCLQHGLRLDKLAHLLITHSHPDHYAFPELLYRMEWFADRKGFPMVIYGNEAVREKYYDLLAQHNFTEERMETAFHVTEYFTPFEAGMFTVTPLMANHSPSEKCMLYMISDNHKTILYAHDTGVFPEETWEFLKGKHLDFVSLDCTNGILPSEPGGHMGLEETAGLKTRLAKMGCIDETSRVVINHFSHYGKLHYDEMVKAAAFYGLDVSYDGAVWEV
jgi:phosphoribosyl 1,2-cyclic phosphate phosphodiesterase